MGDHRPVHVTAGEDRPAPGMADARDQERHLRAAGGLRLANAAEELSADEDGLGLFPAFLTTMTMWL